MRVFSIPPKIELLLYISHNASKALPEIAQVLGVSTGGHVEIYIAPTQDSFLAMQPAIPPDWADGTTWPKSGLIFLRSPTIRSGLSSPLEQVLNHEIAHILLGRAFGHRPVPHWLQEGVAQIVSGEYNGQTMETLGWGKMGSGWYSLQEISRGFPSNAARAKLAYAESAHFVGFYLKHTVYTHSKISSITCHMGIPSQRQFSTQRENLSNNWIWNGVRIHNYPYSGSNRLQVILRFWLFLQYCFWESCCSNDIEKTCGHAAVGRR